MDGKENPEQAEQPEEQPEEKLQDVIDIISSLPSEKRYMIIDKLLAILIIFTPAYRQSVYIEEIQEKIYDLRRELSEENINSLMESFGYILKGDKYFLDASHKEMANRITYLANYFHEDSPAASMQKESERIKKIFTKNTILRISHTLPEYENMPDKLMEKFVDLKHGDLLAEGTVLFSFGRTIFRSAGKGEKIEWRNDLLFDKFNHGTFVRIYKDGISLKVEAGRI